MKRGKYFWGILLTVNNILLLHCATVDQIEKCLCLTSSAKDYCHLNENIISKITEYHNTVRLSLATGKSLKNNAKATNMIKMKWDDELAREAQKYANKCPSTANKDLQQHTRDGFHVEQSFATREWKFPLQKIHYDRFKTSLLRWIHDTKLNSPNSRNKIYELDERGHRKHMLRSSTWKVGCGIGASLTSNETIKEFYICNYLTGDINEAQQLYTVGCEICENCPQNTICEKKSGLCEVEESQTPILRTNYTTIQREIYCPSDEKKARSKRDADDDFLFKCTSFREIECAVQNIDCKSNWTDTNDQIFAKGIVPTKSETSSFLFAREIILPKSNDYCFKFFYRKKAKGSVIAAMAIPITKQPEVDMKNAIATLADKDSFKWENISLEFPSIPADVTMQVGVAVSSTSATKDDDYILVQNFTLIKGKCA